MLAPTTSASTFQLPRRYSRVKEVQSFAELLSTPFAGGLNALCWPRFLPGDFQEVTEALGGGEGIRSLDETTLAALSLTAEGEMARSAMGRDLQFLRARGLAPELNCIHAYPHDEEAAVVQTDVYSFHADSAPVEADTWLCTYHGATSEGLRNDEAQRRIEDPTTRAQLRHLYGGDEGADFAAFLEENCYHLHYAPQLGAQPFSFGLHNLWRIAVDYPGSPVPPCIHRAPRTGLNEVRLLLIS